ncbi:Uncharacterized protein ChrSV_3143 [Chromobacterium vaccinii]|nr:Uncharacterized protein ChrSW_3143 [Chromobacterium vaccinii]QND90600.1 Uncharacterized protein ChrSV_3143 [Chromobacterium vaccinii]
MGARKPAKAGFIRFGARIFAVARLLGQEEERLQKSVLICRRGMGYLGVV